MHLNTLLLLLNLVYDEINGGRKETLKQVKEKAQQKYRSKDKTHHFLGHDKSEYPGTVPKYREMNQNKWNAYYECLIQQDANIGHHQSVTPLAVQAIEGGSIQLQCRICISPKEVKNIHSVEWQSAMEGSKKLEPIDFTEHILISPEDKTLHLYNLRLEQTGQYMCFLGMALTAPYYLTVVKNYDTKFSEVHTSRANKGPYAAKTFYIPGHNLVLKTKWGAWSLCDTCNKVGKRHRYGYCIVFHSDGPENRRIRKQTKNLFKKAEKQITKSDIELVKIFKNGIPCASHILPLSIKKSPAVQGRKDEIMVGFCEEPCPEDKIFEVRDEKGKVIETANNSAGVYSMLQGMPPEEPTVEKRLEYHAQDTNIAISCPGNLNSDAPIQWQIGSKMVIPELISKESDNRIFVGITDSLHIKKAKVSDTNIYSCWQHKELAGMVRLIVEKKFKMNFNHHIMLLGIIAVLSTFFYVFTKAFFGRKSAKIKE